MAMTDVNPQLPRIKLKSPVEQRDLIRYIVGSSGLVASDIVAMIYQLRDCLLHYLEDGVPLRLEGIGIFTPTIKLDGTIQIRFRADKSLVKELNQQNYLKKRIVNRKNIGKSLKELEELLNVNSTD